jgi:hypothetical protein
MTLLARLNHFKVFSHLAYLLLGVLDNVGAKDIVFSCLIPEYGCPTPSAIQHLKRHHFQALLVAYCREQALNISSST